MRETPDHKRAAAVLPFMLNRKLRLGMLACGALVALARADTYTGADWAVHFNLPDQTSSTNSIGPHEFLIRDRLLARIDALSSNDWACLATYTFSNETAQTGVAGPILAATSNALARGAKMGFVVDKGVDVYSNFWPGLSLSGLAARAVNPLELRQMPPTNGIMHDKVGVFWYRAATQGWVMAGSWNFTRAACSLQWNVMAEIQDNALAGAYSNEMRQLLSGNFHSNTNKSHEPDRSPFYLDGMAPGTNGWVRFAPYPDSRYGGTNALTDILAAIDAAQEEIFFGLNLLTRQDVVDALVRACNRGVIVHGAIPKSDQSLADSVYGVLTNPTNFATRNRVVMFDAYYNAAHTRPDIGSSDLIHAKYMVIDPRGANPMVIHGSANWTDSGLVSASANDENVQFIPHRGIAEAFLAQFAKMTDGVKPWCALGSQGASAPVWLDYWLPDAGLYELVDAADLGEAAAWTHRVQMLAPARGTNTLALPRDASRRFFRIQPATP
jgi:hypothetical protein